VAHEHLRFKLIHDIHRDADQDQNGRSAEPDTVRTRKHSEHRGHQNEYGEKHRFEPVETARRLADKFSRRTPRTNTENIAAVLLQVVCDVDGIKADRRIEESEGDDHNRVDDVVERVLVEVHQPRRKTSRYSP